MTSVVSLWYEVRWCVPNERFPGDDDSLRHGELFGRPQGSLRFAFQSIRDLAQFFSFKDLVRARVHIVDIRDYNVIMVYDINIFDPWFTNQDYTEQGYIQCRNRQRMLPPTVKKYCS